MSETVIMRAEEPTFAYLVVAAGDRTGAAYQLRQGVTALGRSGENDVRIDDEEVSSQQAKIRREDGAFCLYDLASTNGTRVNGERVQTHRLRHDDTIELGRTLLIFKQA